MSLFKLPNQQQTLRRYSMNEAGKNIRLSLLRLKKKKNTGLLQRTFYG